MLWLFLDLTLQAEAADYLWLDCSAEIFDLRLPMADDFLELSITSFAWSIASCNLSLLLIY